MKFLERLFTPRAASEREERETVKESYLRSVDKLRQKLDEDICASDPTRRECSPDIADILVSVRQRRGAPRP